tara:strand:- start:5177 stop:5710 length:534 start_codon:yes stop_codon:yes gene_type:complete
MYLVNLDKTGSVIMDDSINAVEEFRAVLDTKSLGKKGMLYVALFCDYDSIYRHFTDTERTRMISSVVFNDYDWKGVKNKKIADAIKAYKALQFDPLDAQLLAFNEKINQYTELMKQVSIDEDNAIDWQKIMIGVDKVLATRQKLLDAIERRGSRTKISGDGELNYLEKKQSVLNKNG